MIYRLQTILWKLHKPQIKIFNFEISILKKNVWWWEYGCKMFLGWLKWSNLSPKLFWGLTMRYFLSPTSFSENCQKPYFHTFTSLTLNHHGMSSYDPKSSSIKKYEFWRIFWIPIILSYLQYIRSYTIMSIKLFLISQL